MPRKSKEFLRCSLAAKKGWQTRRRHERARSQAAKKGWQTRRRHERARSQAAKKGWQTRRRNERKIGGIIRKKKIEVPIEFEPYDEISSLDYGEEE